MQTTTESQALPAIALSSPDAFIPFVKAVGRGNKLRRDLTYDEAIEAMRLILRGEATHAQIGGFLIGQRVKGEAEVEIKGQAKCAKCMLKEGDECQTVIESKGKDGKTTKYYLADNKVAKDFHESVCTEAKNVKATGTVKEVGGKKELTLAKIEPDKTAKSEKTEKN